MIKTPLAYGYLLLKLNSLKVRLTPAQQRNSTKNIKIKLADLQQKIPNVILYKLNFDCFNLNIKH